MGGGRIEGRRAESHIKTKRDEGRGKDGRGKAEEKNIKRMKSILKSREEKKTDDKKNRMRGELIIKKRKRKRNYNVRFFYVKKQCCTTRFYFCARI